MVSCSGSGSFPRWRPLVGHRAITVAILLASGLSVCAPARADETLCNGIDDDGDGRLDESPSCFQDCRMLRGVGPARYDVAGLGDAWGGGHGSDAISAADLARTDMGWAVLSLVGSAPGAGTLRLHLGAAADLRDQRLDLGEIPAGEGLDLTFSPVGLLAAWSAPEPEPPYGEGGIGVYTSVIDPATTVYSVPTIAVRSDGDGVNGDVVRPRLVAAGAGFGLLAVVKVDGGSYERIALTRIGADNRRTDPVTELSTRVLSVPGTDLAWTGEEFIVAWAEVTPSQDLEDEAKGEDGTSRVVRLGAIPPGVGDFRAQSAPLARAESVDIAWTGTVLGVAWREVDGLIRFGLYDRDLHALLDSPLGWPADTGDGAARLGWNGEEFMLTWAGNGGLWMARVDGEGRERDGLIFWEGVQAIGGAPVWDGIGWGMLSPEEGLSLLYASCYCDDPTDPDCPALYRAWVESYGPYGFSCQCDPVGGGGSGGAAAFALSFTVLPALGRRRRGTAPWPVPAWRVASLVLVSALASAAPAAAAGEALGIDESVLVLYGGLPASGTSEREVEDLVLHALRVPEGRRIAHLSEILNLRGGGFEAAGGVRVLGCDGGPAPDLDEAGAAAEAAVRRLDFAGALEAYDLAIAALPCSGKPLALDRLADLWFRRGLVLYRVGDPRGARDSFRQAFLFKPGLEWDETQPPRILRLWMEARGGVQGERGGARLEVYAPRDERRGLFIDGRAVPREGLVLVPRGLHVLTARTTGGPVQLLLESDGRSAAGLVTPRGRESLFLAGPDEIGARPLLQAALASLSSALGYDVVHVVSVPGADPRGSLAYRYERRGDSVIESWYPGERRRRGPVRALTFTGGAAVLGSGPYTYVEIPAALELVFTRIPIRPRVGVGVGFLRAGPDLGVVLPSVSLGATLHGPGRRLAPFAALSLALVGDGREGPAQVRPGLLAGGGIDLHPPRSRFFLRVMGEAGPGPGGLLFRAGASVGFRL